jgi:hypothetical protein
MQGRLLSSAGGAKLLSFALLSCSLPLVAQTPEGSLTGVVHNQGGTRLNQATVTLRENDSGTERVTQANADGEYRFSYLADGKYSIRASAKGLTAVQINDILVQNNRLATVNVTLPESKNQTMTVVEVSEAPEPVDVAAAAAPSPQPSDDAKTINPKAIGREVNGMRDRLAPSADQQIKIGLIFRQRQEQIAAIRNDDSLPPPARREKIKAIRLEADSKFRALLNENQLDEYEEILRERRERALERRQEGTSVSSH